MKKTWIMIGGILILLVAAVIVVNRQRATGPMGIYRTDSHTPADHAATPADHANHAAAPANPGASVIPAYLATAPSRASLGPTLAPEKFTGLTRDAYRAAREIPVTIAQLPCYCHCDQSIGHNSLYSCFEDEHASQCAVCVNEALLALKLEKDGLTAPQIRDRIVETFGRN